MTARRRTLLVGAACSALVLLTACEATHYRGPGSAYAPHYLAMASGGAVEFPDPALLEDPGNGIDHYFDQSIDEVWDACLRVALQQEGILDVRPPDAEPGFLAFVDGQDVFLEIPSGSTNAESHLLKFQDVWLGVRVRSEGAVGTLVSVGWIAGDPLRVRPLPPPAPAAGDDIALTEQELPARRAQLAGVVAETFRQDLVAQLDRPAIWRQRFVEPALPPLPTSPPTALPASDDAARPGGYSRELARRASAYLASQFRRSMVVLHCPDVRERLEAVIARINDRAGGPLESPDVHIVSWELPNATVHANGEVFVTSALLDRLSDLDELAFVLAHELDHVLQQDFASRLDEEADAQAVAVSAAETLAWLAGVPANDSAAMQRAGQSMLSVFGESILLGAQREQELRADAHALRLAADAGFDPTKALSALEKIAGRSGR